MADKDSKPSEVIQEFEAVEKLTKDHDDGRDARPMEVELEWLRIHHLPFRRASQEELRELEELRLHVLDAVLSDPALADYYAEAWLAQSPAASSPAAVSASAAPPAYRRIAIRQLQLMERAFYLLQLHRFANAPENAGWMNLFRRWSSSRRFNLLFDELARTVTPEFRRFYTLYLIEPLKALRLRGLTLAEAEALEEPPIQHPWLRKDHDAGHGLFMDSGLVDIDVRSGSGSLRDPKGDERVQESHEKPSNTPGAQSGGDPPKLPNE